VLVGVVWLAAAVFTLAVAEATRVGPVVVTLVRGHGVHVGDLVALLGSAAAATFVTRRLLRTDL
jgi:hypothetical protein